AGRGDDPRGRCRAALSVGARSAQGQEDRDRGAPAGLGAEGWRPSEDDPAPADPERGPDPRRGPRGCPGGRRRPGGAGGALEMILPLVETDLEGAAIEVSLEAVSFARDISAAGNGVPVDAVVFGDVSDTLRGELAAYGVRTVHRVGGDDVAAYSGAGLASAIQQVRDAA